MAKEDPRYFSYLLRVWQADGDDESVWRASLERPGGTKPRGFASLEEMCAYLRRQIAACPGSARPTTLAKDRETDDERGTNEGPGKQCE